MTNTPERNETVSENVQDKDNELARLVRNQARTTRVVIHNVKELGALLRIARQRLNMSQTDAAICCNVGRRFYVELENGKPSVHMDKVLTVLDALGLNLALGGPGTAFTVEQLANACLKQEENEPEHVWEAEFATDIPAPYEEERTAKARGRQAGSVDRRWRRRNAISTEGHVYRLPEEKKPEPILKNTK